MAQAVRGLTGAVRTWGIEAIFISMGEGAFCDEMRGRGELVQVAGVRRMPSLDGKVPRRLLTAAVNASWFRRARPPVEAALRRAQVDAVHALWPAVMLAVAPVARALGLPCIWEMPNVLGDYPLSLNRWIMRRQLRRYGVAVLANSRATAVSLGADPQPAVMYLGGDAERFRPDRTDFHSRASLGIPLGVPTFGMVAGLWRGKGQADFLHALAGLPGEHPACHLLLVGGPLRGDYADEIRAAAADLGMAGRLHMVGEASRPERYYGVIDVAVNAYRGAESFGLSVVEAMLCGKPVLAHALGGPAETVLDGVTGWHIREPTVEALRGGVIRALADRSRWATLGAAGRSRAMSEYTLEKQASFYARFAREVVGRGRPSVRQAGWPA